MLLDTVEAVDHNINGALAEGSDGGAAVAEGDLLRRCKISNLGEHGNIIAESFGSSAGVIAHVCRRGRRGRRARKCISTVEFRIIVNLI